MKKLLIIVLFGLFSTFPALGMDIPIMSKENLKEKLGSGEITILDARSGNHWDGSIFKIPGALRTPADQIEIWSTRFNKNQKLVVYCACSGLGTSGSLVRKLVDKGFTQVYALDGGWREWYGAAYPIEEKKVF